VAGRDGEKERGAERRMERLGHRTRQGAVGHPLYVVNPKGAGAGGSVVDGHDEDVSTSDAWSSVWTDSGTADGDVDRTAVIVEETTYSLPDMCQGDYRSLPWLLLRR